MSEWVTQAVHSMGYPGIVALMWLETVFPPVPSELIMPLAGFLTAQGKFSLVGVVLAGALGSVLGALPLYALGYCLGEDRVKRWADVHGSWLMVSGKDVDAAKGWLDRHGRKAVFLCRLVPGLRSLISVPAGFACMPLKTFLLHTALGTTVWVALLACAGRLLGESYGQVETYLGPVTYVVFGLILVVFVVHVVRRKHEMTVDRGGPR